MVTMVLFLLTFVSVSTVTQDLPPPPPPQQVHLKGTLLTWRPATETPPTEEVDLTYSVQSRYHADDWRDVPACTNTSSTSCDVTEVAAGGRHGCVMLQVRAERRGLNSEPVQACSLQENSCSPNVSLSARPSSLTVHLYLNYSLAEEHAAHAKHRVRYGREGALMQEFKDSTSSLTLRPLEAGQRYCVQVEYILHNLPVGPPRCPLCETVPQTGVQVQAGVISVVAVVLFSLTIAGAFVLIFKKGWIKRLLRPPYQIPDHFYLLQPPHSVSTCSPTEESCDVIRVVREDRRAGEQAM